MTPYQLPEKEYAAFLAGQFRAWRRYFMRLARERVSTRSIANCVGHAREYHKNYLRFLARAHGKEFPK